MKNLCCLETLKNLALIILTFTIAGCATSVTAPVQNTESESLQAILDDSWERVLKNNPTGASGLGDLRYNHLWRDMSMSAIEARHDERVATLTRLKQIDKTSFTPADVLNYELFKLELEQDIETHQYRHFLIPLNQRGGIQTANDLSDRIPFKTEKHYQDWITRLESFGAYMDQTLALMRQGINEGLVHPKVIMERLPDQIASQIKDRPEDSPFYAPFKKKPDGMDSQQFSQLQDRGAQAVQSVVIPAYQRMADFFRTEYLPAARDSVGVWDTPNGKTYYELRARNYTTTELTPDEIHAIGLSEVERIRGEMHKVMEGLDYRGSFEEFLEFLRTDPQFYYDTPEALLQDYLATSKRIDPELVKLFSDLPRMPYGVRPIPDAIAPDTTTAYYSGPAADGSRAGYYYVNLYRPEVRPKYEIEVLTVHEAMPGHHLQIALAQELGDLPNFRRYGGYTAFVEGWGLYSESLGEALGLYKDPYSKFGQLTYEMWRAVRLVVDTGIHYKGWSRQQAIDFFKSNAAKSEYDIINEIDRYIAWPGQALAYKIGELKIKELRKRSEQQLGDDFDIRAFHKVVLGSGAVPLSILEKNVDDWIAAQL